MSCKCFEEMNVRLKPHNVQIAHGFGINRELNKLTVSYFVQTEKIDTAIRGKKAPLVVMKYCPLCGVELTP